MEPKSSNKKLGVGLSVLIVALVILVPTFLERKTLSPIINTKASDASAGTKTDIIGNQNNQQTPITNQTQNTKPIVNNTGEDSYEGEDDEGSQTQVPVQTPKPIPVPAPVINNTKNSASAYAYKNGTYTAIGSYMSPGGYDQIGVTLTIKNDLVTNSSVNLMPGDNTSARYQQTFADNYQQYVVGQNISGLNLGKISRSSLTPQGFNDALNQIRSQAKV